MDIFLIILSGILLLVGLLGCVLPALPGPPVSYVGVLLLHWTDRVQFSTAALLVISLLVVIAQVLDYFIPLLGSKYSGGTKRGSWGAFIGSVVGLFFLPIGLILGPFFGALFGELSGEKNLSLALKSGIGALIGFLLGTVLKLALCSYFIYLYISSLL